ncbi:hypothetical protein Taro_015841 [Colocasia esculenta]|uniref:Uncharacterized protein n=1 Tax=Colocasia esculenta TaxID=4460 RepID=A0A843ULY1_COLES|nr:hypothetical protein [Colocasia esculenta]
MNLAPLEKLRSEFLSLATSSQGTKGTPLKNSSGISVIRSKASGRAEYTLASSPVAQPSLKARRDAMFKHSEATDFRNWCERELFRLTGAKDTGFLEFCLKQPISEAKTLLRENLGLLDPNHEFIDKLLNYKEFLPADVIEIAFQSHPEHKVDGVDTTLGYADMGADDADSDMLAGLDGPGKGGGKKKGKKGKKVSPSVLGFNIVSNRIMMGDIQNVED